MSELSAPAPVGAELMSVSDAARMLGLSRITVLRRIKSGAWPGGRTGRKYLVNRPFAVSLAAEFGSGRNVDAEDFAAGWMARSPAVPLSPGAVA